jgi:23S rRNA (pseudouridine1915-N3)-methyltransferase
MRLRIFSVGKTKESYAKEAVKKYMRLIMPLADIEMTEIKEQKDKPVDVMLGEEGRKIIKMTSGYMLLDERGRSFTSVEFASMLCGLSQADFVLGGAYGVSDEVRKGAKALISLSPMTLTHDMARVLLLEQLYRALMINAGRKGYHH